MRRVAGVRRALVIAAAAALGLMAAASGAFAAPTGYGVGDDANLYAIDLATGTATLVGSTGLGASISGLSFSSTGTLYGIETSTNTANLVTINPTTGAATLVGSTGVVDASTGVPTGLTFTPDGRLLMAHQSTIYQVNPATGLATAIGATGIGSVDALASDCAGTVYTLKVNGGPPVAGLYTVNTTTGAATLIGSLNPNIPGIAFGAGLDVDLATGVLWEINSDGVAPAGPSDVHTINPTTLADQLASSVAGRTITGLAISSSCATPANAVTGAVLDFTG